jgi:hypothetical protein
MILAEDLFLLMLDGRTGRVFVPHANLAMAGAVLMELNAAGAIEEARVRSFVRDRIVVGPMPPPAHPILLTAFDRLRVGDRHRIGNVMRVLTWRHLRRQVVDGLMRSGMVRREQRRVLGLFPATRLVVQNGAYVSALRDRVRAVLTWAAPDERTAALIALLFALDAALMVVVVPDWRVARRRAKEIAAVQSASNPISAQVLRTIIAERSGLVVAVTGVSVESSTS